MQNPSESPQWNILSLLKWTTSYFASRNVENPRASAEILLSHTLNLRRIDLYIRYDQPMTKEELASFKALIKRRASGEPVAYVTGEKGFRSLELSVSPDVLIPRPETEILVESALSLIPEDGSEKPMRVLELGTGSGAIILSLASERPGHCFYASDCSVKALNMAKQNALRHKLENAVFFFASDWFSALKPSHYDLILSNPPYIPTDDIETLQPEIRKFEPITALDGGKDGLTAIRHIIFSAKDYLAPGGSLMLEIGYDQKKSVSDIAEQSGAYQNIRFIRDYAGHDRVLHMTSFTALMPLS